MKRFKLWILVSIGVYLVLAVTIANQVEAIKVEDRDSYRVEINRILKQLEASDLASIQQHAFQYIESIDFLPANSSQEPMQQFFMEDNHKQTHLQPWYQDNVFQGYLKFTTMAQNDHTTQFLILAEGALLLLQLLILGILCYLYRHLIVPFETLVDLPEKMAQGHFQADITVRKGTYLRQFLWGMGQLKDALDVSKKRQMDLLKEKKQLLLSLSHDIKTPLNLIKLYAKALQEEVCQDEMTKQKAYHQIEDKVTQIEYYVDEIIHSSRNELFDLQVEQGEFYLSDLIQKVLSIYKEQCSLRHIDLQIEVFENRLLKGDIERSLEVLENLFENALKYGDGIKLTLSFYEEDYCQLIRLSNTGPKVSEHEIPHLFDSFFRGSNSEGKTGSGLGLYICQELMRKMGGAIFAEAERNGMAFVLVFR